LKIVTICNQKGGTGKTTTAINLGCALAARNKKILLIDLDPQQNLSYSLGITPTNGDIIEVLQAKKTIQEILVKKENLYIAPSSVSLADYEVSLINKIGREQILKDCLRNIRKFDYVFIDSPPSLSILTVNALNAAHNILIPLQMEILSLQGLLQLLNTIKEVKHALNRNLKITGIIPSMYDCRRRLSHEILNEIQQNIKVKIFKTNIRECVKIAEAPSFAKSVLQYAPKSNGAADFTKLAKEFLKIGG